MNQKQQRDSGVPKQNDLDDQDEDVYGEEEMYGEEEYYEGEEEYVEEGEEEEPPDHPSPLEDKTNGNTGTSQPALIKQNLPEVKAINTGSSDQRQTAMLPNSPQRMVSVALPQNNLPKQTNNIMARGNSFGEAPETVRLEEPRDRRPIIKSSATTSNPALSKTHSRLPSRSEAVRVIDSYPDGIAKSVVQEPTLDQKEVPRFSKLPVKIPGAYTKPIVIDNSTSRPSDTKRSTPSNALAMLKEVTTTGLKPTTSVVEQKIASPKQSQLTSPGKKGLNVYQQPTLETKKEIDRSVQGRGSITGNSFSSVYNNSPQKALGTAGNSNNGSSQNLPSLQNIVGVKPSYSRQSSMEEVVIFESLPTLKKQDSAKKIPIIAPHSALKSLGTANISKPKLFFDPSRNSAHKVLEEPSTSRRNSIHNSNQKPSNGEKDKTVEAPYIDLPSVSKSIGRSKPTALNFNSHRSQVKDSLHNFQESQKVQTLPSEERRVDRVVQPNFSLNSSLAESKASGKGVHKRHSSDLAKEPYIFGLGRKLTSNSSSKIDQGIDTYPSARPEVPILDKVKQYLLYCSKEIKLRVPEFEQLNNKGLELMKDLQKLNQSLQAQLQSSTLMGKKLGSPGGSELPPTYSKSTMAYLLLRYSKDIETNKMLSVNMEKELDRVERLLDNVIRPG
jgi:hypothetical protein